jgi:hypothetical protein
MQLVGIRAGDRRAGHVVAQRLGPPRQAWCAARAELAVAGPAPEGDDARCRAGRRPEGPAQGDCGRRSAASPGTRLGPCAHTVRVGVRVGRLHRRHQHLHTFRSEHVIESAPELRIPIANKEAQPASSLFMTSNRLRLLDDPCAFGIGGHAAHVNPPGVQLDEEQHLQPSQPDGVDGEAGRRPRFRRLAGEGTPARCCSPPRCRVEPVAAQRRADRGRRDPHAEVHQFALDALVAPVGFSLARRMISCWMSWSSGGRPVWRPG